MGVDSSKEVPEPQWFFLFDDLLSVRSNVVVVECDDDSRNDSVVVLTEAENAIDQVLDLSFAVDTRDVAVAIVFADECHEYASLLDCY